MPIVLLDTHKEYQRYRHTAQEKITLADHGFTHVLSSTISALAYVGQDLLIRFHTGDVYRYPNQAKLFRVLLEADSKGRAFWVLIRRPNKPFIKEGKNFSLESDLNLPTEEFIELQIVKPNESIDEYLREIGMFIPNDELSLPFIPIGELIK